MFFGVISTGTNWMSILELFNANFLECYLHSLKFLQIRHVCCKQQVVNYRTVFAVALSVVDTLVTSNKFIIDSLKAKLG